MPIRCEYDDDGPYTGPGAGTFVRKALHYCGHPQREAEPTLCGIDRTTIARDKVTTQGPDATCPDCRTILDTGTDPRDGERPHVYVYATIRDRYDSAPVTEYVGAVEAWAWADTKHRRTWTADRRKMLLSERTSDPRGWRVTFAGLHTHPDDDPGWPTS